LHDTLEVFIDGDAVVDDESTRNKETPT